MTATEITLKNGETAPDVAVTAIMLNLRLLADQDPIAFYELVSVCKDAGHVPWGDTGEILQRRGLLESGGQPHGITRDVVLSAVTGEDTDMALGSPYQEG